MRVVLHLKDIGVIEFFEKLDLLTETSYKDEDEFAAQVYKIRHDESGNQSYLSEIIKRNIKSSG